MARVPGVGPSHPIAHQKEGGPETESFKNRQGVIEEAPVPVVERESHRLGRRWALAMDDLQHLLQREDLVCALGECGHLRLEGRRSHAPLA